MALWLVGLLMGMVGWGYWRWMAQRYLDAHGLASDPEHLARLLGKSANSICMGAGVAVAGFLATAVLRHVWSRSLSGG
ncbi:MAG TPA: hypothetical protein PK280_16295 [Planctomycetota bacterium]|nr:hypothetical protein [Planctomycetota bacterium]